MAILLAPCHEVGRKASPEWVTPRPMHGIRARIHALDVLLTQHLLQVEALRP